MNIFKTILIVSVIFPFIGYSKASNPCEYFHNIPKNTRLNQIVEELNLPSPNNTHMGNSSYTDRVFEYVLNDKSIIRIGLTGDTALGFAFNGDYFFSSKLDSCSNWSEKPVVCDTVRLKNREFLEHDYDGGAILEGIFCNGNLEQIYVEIGVSNGFYITDYEFSNCKLIKIREKEKVFPYVDSIYGFDYKRLDLVYEVTYTFKQDKPVKLKETGKRILGENKERETFFISDFIKYRKALEEKKKKQ